MNKKEKLFCYIQGMGDNALILGHRLAELCGHGPALEIDMALSNISLDLLGQTRSYFQYGATLGIEEFNTEDSIAYSRDARDFKNVLLVEQPNEDFAYTIVRQFLFDSYHYLFLHELQNSKDKTLKAIAEKSIKEVAYHLRFSSQWMKRMGDGTEVSHEKMQTALNDLWDYRGELFVPTDIEQEMADKGIGVEVSAFKETYEKNIARIIEEATLKIPESTWVQKGGKEGKHTEHMGYILSELQWMQRAYPNMEW